MLASYSQNSTLTTWEPDVSHTSRTTTHPQGLRHHGGGPNGKDNRQDVNGGVLVSRDELDGSEREVTVGAHGEPARVDKVGHHGVQAERRRDGDAFEVLGLAGSVGRDKGDRGVEPGKAGKTARDKQKETNNVEGSAEAHNVAEGGGGDTERDEIGERVHLLAEHRTTTHPSRHLTVESVKAETKHREDNGSVECTGRIVGERSGQVRTLEQVARGQQDRQCATHSVHDCDQVRETEITASLAKLKLSTGCM